MDNHQPTTPRNSTTKTTGARRSRDSQSSHMADTAKDVANATPQSRGRQIGIVDGQGRPSDEQDPEQQPYSPDRPVEKFGQKAAQAQCALLKSGFVCVDFI